MKMLTLTRQAHDNDYYMFKMASRSVNTEVESIHRNKSIAIQKRDYTFESHKSLLYKS